MEIATGLHQLKVPIPNNPVGYVLPYVFDVPGGLAIIDPGWDAEESVASLQSQLAEIGAGFGNLKQIIVTHVHPDHFGMAGRLREASGAQIVVHEADIAFLRWRSGGGMGNTDDWFTRHGLPAGAAPLMRGVNAQRFVADLVEPDRLMADGELLRLGAYELRVIWTPGHSPGHACFWEERRELLLTGDHVLPTISPNVSLWPGLEADPLGDYIRSLEKLRGLKPKKVYPAHEYAFDDLHRRLDELEAHHEERLQEMLDAVRGGAATAYAIAREVRWAIGHFDNFNPATRRAAMTETLAHLRYLANQRRLREVDVNGVVGFKLPG